MARSHHPKLRRGGFTLVEMIVVIAIIAVLAALITPAVMKFLVKGPQITTAAEITNIDAALQNFLNTMKVKTIPSKIMLCERYGDYNAANVATPGTLEFESVNYLKTLFPHILDTDPATNNVRWQVAGIDWNGDGTIGANAAARRFTLEGDQCLVFFLGGIPARAAGCLGFSTDPRDPAKLAQTTGRLGPFFEFPSARLTKRLTPAASAGNTGFYSYLDPYKKNGTNRPDGNWYAFYSAHTTSQTYNPFGTNDCLGLGAKVYTEAGTRFYKANSWQIISAGADGNFGQAGVIPDNSAAGKDDQCNFNNGSLVGVAP